MVFSGKDGGETPSPKQEGQTDQSGEAGDADVRSSSQVRQRQETMIFLLCCRQKIYKLFENKFFITID